MCKCVSYVNAAFILRTCTSLLCRRKKRTPKRWRIFVRAFHTYKTSCTGLSTTANRLHCFFWYTKLEAVSSTCHKGNADEGNHESSRSCCRASADNCTNTCICYVTFWLGADVRRHREFRARLHKLNGEVSEAMAGSGDKPGQSQMNMAALNASKQQVRRAQSRSTLRQKCVDACSLTQIRHHAVEDTETRRSTITGCFAACDRKRTAISR